MSSTTPERSPLVDPQHQAIKRLLFRGFSPAQIVRALRAQYRVSRSMVQQVAQNPIVQDELKALEAARERTTKGVRAKAEESALEAYRVIRDTFRDPTVKPADRLKAAVITLEIAGQGPSSVAARNQQSVNVIFTGEEVPRQLQSHKDRMRQVRDQAAGLTIDAGVVDTNPVFSNA